MFTQVWNIMLALWFDNTHTHAHTHHPYYQPLPFYGKNLNPSHRKKGEVQRFKGRRLYIDTQFGSSH